MTELAKLIQEHNAAVANGLHSTARLLARRLATLARQPSRVAMVETRASETASCFTCGRLAADRVSLDVMARTHATNTGHAVTLTSTVSTVYLAHHIADGEEPAGASSSGPDSPGSWTSGLRNVHDPAACEGRGCSIHHPSDHPMASWPKVWRGWHGYFERQCPHGIGHPDPDDMAYIQSTGRDEPGVHGCDGCCVFGDNASPFPLTPNGD